MYHSLAIKPAMQSPSRVIDMRITHARGGTWTGAFTGIVYAGSGVRFDLGLPSADDLFVKVTFGGLGGVQAEYSEGPMPSPWPNHEVWYEVAKTSGNIVCPSPGY